MLDNNSLYNNIIKNNVIPKRNLGQNFLINENIISKICEKSNITKEDTVLEIGPGLGFLTRKLIKHAKKVIAIEKDKNLALFLSKEFSEFDNIEIINKDILEYDFRCIGTSNIKVVANLPYYITTPIIINLIENITAIKSITIMVQKEVGNRLLAINNSKEIGAITYFVNYYCNVNKILDVKSTSFYPRPKVDSVVVRLDKRDNVLVNTKNKDYMFKIIRSAFNMRRKTLVNALTHGDLHVNKDKLLSILKENGIDSNIRGEKLKLEDYSLISDMLCEGC